MLLHQARVQVSHLMSKSQQHGMLGFDAHAMTTHPGLPIHAVSVTMAIGLPGSAIYGTLYLNSRYAVSNEKKASTGNCSCYTYLSGERFATLPGVVESASSPAFNKRFVVCKNQIQNDMTADRL